MPINNKHASMPAVSYFTALDFANTFWEERLSGKGKLKFGSGSLFVLRCDLAVKKRCPCVKDS